MISELDEPEQEEEGEILRRIVAFLLAYYESRDLAIDETSEQLECEDADVLVS
jgi:hypothetical protein